MIAKKGFLKREQFTSGVNVAASHNLMIRRNATPTQQHNDNEEPTAAGDANDDGTEGVATLRKNRALNANNYRNGINR